GCCAHGRGIVLPDLLDSFPPDTRERNEANTFFKTQLRHLLRIAEGWHLRRDQAFAAFPLLRQDFGIDFVGAIVTHQVEGMCGSERNRRVLVVQGFFQLGDASLEFISPSAAAAAAFTSGLGSERAFSASFVAFTSFRTRPRTRVAL